MFKYKLLASGLLVLFLFSGCKRDSVTEFKVEVPVVLQELLKDEDTDNDDKITKDDQGDRIFIFKDIEGEEHAVESTYHLANLLQELAIAKQEGKDTALLMNSRILEKPSHRISRNIKENYWDDLTRTVDEKGLARILEDSKSSDTIVRRLYVPATDTLAQKYFKGIEGNFQNFKVVTLPERITPEYVKSINTQPGILALKLKEGMGVPFVVPGGRFNEMYGWDSYFEGVGLLIDGRVDLAKAMVENFCYQIKYYGKILNANRSYYLTRTQPPFLTSFIREVYEADPERNKEWLAFAMDMAFKEYETVWMEKGVRLTDNGLNRYRAGGIGIPPETEAGHFDEILKTFTERYNEKHKDFEKQALTVAEFTRAYQAGEIVDRDLDTYFLHDRSLRESGHDTSWRLDGICASLNTVGLNSLLYKYEKDFEYLIATYFDGAYDHGNYQYTAADWLRKAEARKTRMNSLMWNEERGGFYDYNLETGRMTDFDAATNYFPLWAGLATEEQAGRMVSLLEETLKEHCGVAATSRASVLKYATNDVQRQWDYPNGWAPHQMVVWRGFLNYGFEVEATELAYRWLWMITRNAVDYNGTIPEKYDVVDCTHKVYAEYGNVGTDFSYITTSGFGWMNASYQLGLTLLDHTLTVELDQLKDPDLIFKSK
ncbi:trehalase family glycosidase [Robertkochia solimangrovi]|uniref:trehalase family glycosidase n=1 Tax=Robertkochia solimangrovi TaxID=2213046 RepID=UPI0011804A54|nr:trehalase family glycosidase [Robertkochia solimangrovi]TRZ45787.1 trehalase [Robertkochia solimangrovi]